MCTLIVATGLEGGPDLFVIANRDEALDRPARGPELGRAGEFQMVCPRDEEAGGTWVGLNERGVFAGITNRFLMESEPLHRSRGELVLEALKYPTSGEAADAVQGLSPRDYNGFHLILADRREAWVVWNDGKTFNRVKLTPGFHVFSERSFDAAPSRRLEGLEAKLARFEGWGPGREAELRRWMRQADDDEALEGTCICQAGSNYGTRSSTIVELGESTRFLYADGPPCTTAYQDVELNF